jgi:transcriptional regulator with XRE-family HTH domain
LDEEAVAFAQIIGLLLRKARVMRGMSRGVLGDRLLIGASTLQRMEAGDPRVSLGYYLAMGRELGVAITSAEVTPTLTVAVLQAEISSRARRKSKAWF